MLVQQLNQSNLLKHFSYSIFHSFFHNNTTFLIFVVPQLRKVLLLREQFHPKIASVNRYRIIILFWLVEKKSIIKFLFIGRRQRHRERKTYELTFVFSLFIAITKLDRYERLSGDFEKLWTTFLFLASLVAKLLNWVRNFWKVVIRKIHEKTNFFSNFPSIFLA